MNIKSKSIRRIFLVLGLVCFMLGVAANWREYIYHKSSTVAKASILSVDIKPMSGKAVASINYVITYHRDNLPDTMTYSTTEEYSIHDPLPAIDSLKSDTWFVHYIPIEARKPMAYNDRVYITNSSEMGYEFRSGWFTTMLVLFIFGYMLSRAPLN